MIDNQLFKVQPLESGPLVPIISGASQSLVETKACMVRLVTDYAPDGQDASLFTLPPYLSDFDQLTEANYTDFLAQWGRFAEQIGRQYPLSQFNQSGSTPAAILRAITRIITLSSYTCPMYKSLRAVNAHSIAGYAYIFNHTPHCPWLFFDQQPFPGKFAKLFGRGPYGRNSLRFSEH